MRFVLTGMLLKDEHVVAASERRRTEMAVARQPIASLCTPGHDMVAFFCCTPALAEDESYPLEGDASSDEEDIREGGLV